MIGRRILFAALAALSTAGMAEAGDPAYGYWLTQNERAIIEIGPCGKAACGRIIWSAAPYDASGKLKLDARNDDPALRTRPLCGLQLIGGFDRSDAGHWRDGWIYNPRNGQRYDAMLDAQTDGTLKVRGFLGVELLGRTQVWTRVGDDRGGCGGL